MCGILGGINFPINKETLNLIRHRGPDRQAIYADERTGYHISLAHSRLSIVDLSAAGNQPMVSPCGNYVLIYNGEIYNHTELREKLDFKQYRGHSDTETLLHFLMERGIEYIHELNGIFSFIFYDKKRNWLCFARDPYGVKPLYYYFDGNCFIACSEIRPMRMLLPLSIDTGMLRMLLNLRYMPSPYTLYKHIYKVRPGHYGVIDLSNPIHLDLSHNAYIQLNSKRLDITFKDAVKEYGAKIEKAVSRQLMGDVDVGILLSGGIDSALISHIAAKKCGRKLKAFTIGFDSRYAMNEIEWAKETAGHIGMEHHVVKIGVDDFFDCLKECTQILEEPLGDTSVVPMYYLSRLASQHVKVVLSGQGADEPLGGYFRYQGEVLRSLYPHVLFTMANKCVRLLPVRNESVLRGARSLGIDDDIERFFQEYCLFTEKETDRLLGGHTDYALSREPIAYFYHLVTEKWQTPVEKMMSIDMRMNLADDLLMYTDKISMNFSMECRVPMLDTELVDYVQSLPADYKIQRKKTKIIHKFFASKHLPSHFAARPKLGFQSPTNIWFREKAAMIEDKLTHGCLRDYFSVEGIKQIVKQHRNGYNREKQLFLLLSINEWLEQ